MAKVHAPSHTLHEGPPKTAANADTFSGSLGKAVTNILHQSSGGSIAMSEAHGLDPSEANEKFNPAPLRYVAMHFQCLGMHGYTRPDGTWVIGTLEKTHRPDVKITDFPIEPNRDESTRIEGILEKNDIEAGYIKCSPRTIIKLLLEGVQLLEHRLPERENGYFQFAIGGKKVWCAAEVGYDGFSVFRKSDE